MTDLITNPNLDDPDAAYAMLIAAHDGLAAQESAALNARLILLLVNHLGDPTLLEQALQAARR
ncbi:DUF2783 domain-containing protein [Jannaschia sp. S6380]|uniref:DUF2783 domain-containing protein n=1 Tax=Jannaschia sp. S6380 TaxID=2926408 RepID=UPI001FF19E0B|nr:DUF2783 domain-containing protein [Jannaschia sp. S6380]MCK0166571.1 DUF2783 domain-containing protein [Jannaschia sp. S6380]